jgi:hypothetical protein
MNVSGIAIEICNTVLRCRILGSKFIAQSEQCIFFVYYYKRNDEEDISNYIKRAATGGIIHPNMGE